MKKPEGEVIIIKKILLLFLLILFTCPLWSQDFSTEKNKIEQILIGTWRETFFSIPGKIELKHVDNNLKDVVILHSETRTIKISDNGDYNSTADNIEVYKYKWTVIPSDVYWQPFTLQLEGEHSDSTMEVLILDEKTLIVTSSIWDNNGEPYIFSSIWQKNI